MMTAGLFALVVAATPDLAPAAAESLEVLESCADVGCARGEGARAAFLLAVHTYLEEGIADGTLAATVRELDRELYGDLPDVLQRASTEPLPWALRVGGVEPERVVGDLVATDVRAVLVDRAEGRGEPVVPDVPRPDRVVPTFPDFDVPEQGTTALETVGRLRAAAWLAAAEGDLRRVLRLTSLTGDELPLASVLASSAVEPDAGLSPADTWRVAVHRARRARREGDPLGAVTLLSTLNPATTEVELERARAYVDLGRLRSASSAYRRAWEAQGAEQDVALRELADLHLGLWDTGTASTLYGMLTDRDEKAAGAFSRARALRADGEPSGAWWALKAVQSGTSPVSAAAWVHTMGNEYC
ncbi:MAG: hypothetical protein KC656_31390, partial [Myxococcales bacterium]|nr:hypothetical protein [Myxococcales bacterium]